MDLPRISLGQASQLYGLTPRALRFYDAKGLVPARRDNLARRYYDGPGRRKLQWIAVLRGAGLTLRIIETVLGDDDDDDARLRRAIGALNRRKRELTANLEAADHLQAELAGKAGEILAGRGGAFVLNRPQASSTNFRLRSRAQEAHAGE